MPEYLLFRPPRRQPRMMAVTTHANKLAIVVIDPWELRYIASHSIPMHNEKRIDSCQIILQESIVRERPQGFAVLATRSTARRVSKQMSKHFDLPLIEISPVHWKRFLDSMKDKSKPAHSTFFKTLPERHVSKALFKNPLLMKTALLAHLALSKSLKHSYDAQPTIEL